MASLFDGYRLSNSTEIPRFEGSAGDELIKVGQYRQNLYDQALNTGMNTNASANELNTMLPQDTWAVDELRNHVSGKIKELAANKDWENAGTEVGLLAREYNNRQQEILAPQQAASEYRKSLGDKEHNLTPEQQQALYAMSVQGYGGLKKNSRGQYIGAFNGMIPAKNIDVNKKADEWLKDAVSHKYGHDAETLSDGDGGMWIIKNGIKTDRLPADKLAEIISAAKANDTEYQAFQNMQGHIAGFNAANSGVSDIKDISSASLRSATQANLSKGLSFTEAYANAVRKATMENIDSNVLNYGTKKYEKNDWSSSFEFNANPYELKKAPNESTVVSPLISQGPDSKLTNDEKDYDKITKNISDTKSNASTIQSSISKLEKDLKASSLSPTTRTQKQTELNGLKNQLDEVNSQNNRAEQIVDYSKDQTARKIGYDDYNDFVEKHKQPFTSVIAKVFPSGFTSTTGRRVSLDDIAEAAVDNRIKPNRIAGAAGTGGGAAGVQEGVTITLKDGSQVQVPKTQKGNQLWDQVAGAWQGKGKAVADFNDKLKDMHEQNVENFAIQSNNISMNEPVRNEVEAHIKSNMDGVKWSDPGQVNSVKAPKDFKVYTVGTLGLGTSTKVRVEELDTDKKPTGKFYDVTLNSNLADIVSNQAAESKDPTARLAADMLSPNSGARQISAMRPGQKVVIGKIGSSTSKDADPTEVSISINRDRQGNPIYNLVDENGDVLKTADGKPYSTDNVGTAGSWIEGIQQKPTFSNGQRQSLYNAKSRRTR